MDSDNHVQLVRLRVLHLDVVELLALRVVLGPVELALLFIVLFLRVAHLPPFLLHQLHDLLRVQMWVFFLN